ncbi:Holliday junction resolvase RuvX [Aquibaculum sediminis]|uniref:Holliday junction resolvase RuvX n=1 Tax=Aquibaculum sediminis TaxID=3231907 RepID=UPI00345196DB
MTVIDLRDLPSCMPARSRPLGLDLGEKTIGLALGTSDFTLASPLETIKRSRFREDAAKLAALCEAHNVGALIIGLPLNMDGTEGKRARSTRQFARNLSEIAGLDLPVAFWDERLSTAVVERFLIGEADMSRRRRVEVVDKMAAAYILQGALDFLRHTTPPAKTPD